MTLPEFPAQRVADLKPGVHRYEGREIAAVSPIGGGVLLIRFVGGGVIKAMADTALTEQARLEDAVAAFDLAYRQARFLLRVGYLPDWPAPMDEGQLAVAMLQGVAQTDAECRAAIMVAEVLTVGMRKLAGNYATDIDLPGRELLDEYDRDEQADRADHLETFGR
ncbi:MAG TPA: hypothetical protein VIT65_05060 [Microlunatus sp.]